MDDEEVKAISSSNRRLSMAGSVDTLIDMESMPPTPPAPILRKELSTATIVRDNKSTPVAQYYPNVTVLFADVVGFTSWSSIRDPYQVFTLLETLYEAFDELAEAKGVFKVETVGDCYVCAAGIPQPQSDHAVVMAKFSRRALENATGIFVDLEDTLGPGTAELGMRFGIHSGPVMAGVLRGSKQRFQLFGDTMNVTSRIESSSVKNKIHLSEQTADCLVAAGKGEWVEQREKRIMAKGCVPFVAGEVMS
jgi:class 3 adenylate cyclase